MGCVGCVDLKFSEDSFGDHCFAMSKYSRVNRGNKILREVSDVRICGVGGVAGLNF